MSPRDGAAIAAPRDTMENGITMTGVSKTYRAVDGRAVAALQAIDMHIKPNEFVCPLGHSGCGKTTLLNIIAGFIPPSSGEIRAIAGLKIVSGEGDAVYLRASVEDYAHDLVLICGDAPAYRHASPVAGRGRLAGMQRPIGGETGPHGENGRIALEELDLPAGSRRPRNRMVRGPRCPA